MSNNFSREKCDTNDNQNKSVNPWTRDEKRSPAKEKVENKCNHLFFRKDWHSFKYSFDVQFLSYQFSTYYLWKGLQFSNKPRNNCFTI